MGITIPKKSVVSLRVLHVVVLLVGRLVLFVLVSADQRGEFTFPSVCLSGVRAY